MKNYRVSIILVLGLLFLLTGSNMLMAQETDGKDKTSDKTACCPGGQVDPDCTPDNAKDADCCPEAIRIEDCTPEQRAECMKACDSSDPKCIKIEKKGK